MDEGTSHLDITTERQVTAVVDSPGLTRGSSPAGDDRLCAAPPGIARRELHEMLEGLLAA
jgi:hypothetical protein